MLEQEDTITVEKYGHLLNDKVALIIQQVLLEHPLPFELQDFQKLTLHALGSGQNVILVAPTGCGKMIVAYLAILVLQKVHNEPKGVGLGTQPLSSIMEEKLMETFIPTGVFSMKGDFKSSKNFSEEEDLFLSDPMEDLKSGKVTCLLGHAESWLSSSAQDVLESLQKQNLILFTFLDEAHIPLDSHWDSFRPQLQLVPGQLRGKAVRGATCLAMTATLTTKETEELQTDMGFRSNTAIIRGSPIQEHHKFVRIERPPSLYGSYGKEMDGVSKPGLVQALREVYLDKFIECMENNIPVKHCIMIFDMENHIADVNDFLCDELPVLAEDPSMCPWVVNHSSIGPATAKSIRVRSKGGEVALFLTTSVMLMGMDFKDIDIIVMVRPFAMLHSMVQAVGRGGRKMMDKFRRRAVFYLLFNNTDIAPNSTVSAEVKDFCTNKGCLKQIFLDYFGAEGNTGGTWCCSNCDGV